jgi:hypothetical protein
MSDHTPGPWKARDYKNDDGDIWVDCDSWRNPKTASCRGGTLATAHEHGAGEGTVEGNARLIAAAPEMLAALELIQAGFRDGAIKWAKPRQSDSDPYHPANTAMCNAISKATG